MSRTPGQIATTPTGRPDGDLVNRVRLAFAGLIDLVESIPSTKDDGLPVKCLVPEIARPRAVALTELESASHWAVKAAARAEKTFESAGNPESGDPPKPSLQN